MHNLKPDYILGLVDGEGSFTMYVRDPKLSPDKNRRVTVEPKFYIKLIEKDRIILEKVQKFFGCGSIYFQKDTRPNHQHCYRYEVFNRKELTEIIIPFFKKHTLQFVSKQNDFKLFCKMMEIVIKGKHLTKDGLGRLFELKQHMH